eukprot:SAG31_NODE_2350_length_5893_cov_2.633414_5_plen_192_part_00
MTCVACGKGFELTSADVGSLKVGEVVQALETKRMASTGQTRLRFAGQVCCGDALAIVTLDGLESSWKLQLTTNVSVQPGGWVSQVHKLSDSEPHRALILLLLLTLRLLVKEGFCYCQSTMLGAHLILRRRPRLHGVVCLIALWCWQNQCGQQWLNGTMDTSPSQFNCTRARLRGCGALRTQTDRLVLRQPT